MKKKIIQDIRLFKSDSQLGIKKLNAMVKRVVMKLRENEFSLGEFDHLYINFVPREEAPEMILSDNVDRYHPWYRYCTVPAEPDFYNRLGSPETYDAIIHRIGAVLVRYFASEDFDADRILCCVRQAAEAGEKMEMKFREKVSAKRKAVIFLRYLDTCRFLPLLRVYDTEDRLLLEKDLPETLTLDCLGEIQLSSKRVTIKPRKNAFTARMEPMVFEY